MKKETKLLFIILCVLLCCYALSLTLGLVGIAQKIGTLHDGDTRRLGRATGLVLITHAFDDLRRGERTKASESLVEETLGPR